MFPDIFNGKNPFYNGFEHEYDTTAREYMRLIAEAQRQMRNGELYIKFVSGDRAGSIAKVSPDTERFGDNAVRDISIGHNRNSWYHNLKYRFENGRFYGICRWDGRKNKVSISLPHVEVVFLLNYKGPTVWEKFDAKSAKEEVLKNPNQNDIDGKPLAIGDKVLYINARYGSAMTLCHGEIKEFTALVNSSKTDIFTVVESEDGSVSTISNPGNMIYKKGV